jgi:hypothetical protein
MDTNVYNLARFKADDREFFSKYIRYGFAGIYAEFIERHTDILYRKTTQYDTDEHWIYPHRILNALLITDKEALTTALNHNYLFDVPTQHLLLGPISPDENVSFVNNMQKYLKQRKYSLLTLTNNDILKVFSPCKF